jgi:hypothetical protein
MVEKMGRSALALVVMVLSLLAILASGSIIDYYYSVYAQSPEDTTVPITVSLPINIQAQNAQICASILSSGSQTCQQIILNPTQTSYQPVGIDLVQPIPTINTPAPLPPLQQQQQQPQPLAPQGVLISLPVNIQAQNAQLCISVASSGSQTCQQIVINPSQTSYQPVNVDFTQPTPTFTTPRLQQQPGQQLQDVPVNSLSIGTNIVNIDSTDVTLPVNVITQTNIQTQNAQLCISVASSGSQTCQQIVINPSQTSYQPVSVDFTQATPTIESTDSIPTAPGPATEDTTIPTSTPTTSPTPTGQSPTAPESQLQEQEQQPSQESQPEQEPTTTPDDTDTSEQNPTEEGDTNGQDETSTEEPDSTGNDGGSQEGQ